MSFLERQLEDPVRFARIKRWFYIGLVAVAAGGDCSAAACLASPASTRISGSSGFPRWGSLYGLVSCVAIIVVSKFLGKVWLMRREDYYDS